MKPQPSHQLRGVLAGLPPRSFPQILSVCLRQIRPRPLAGSGGRFLLRLLAAVRALRRSAQPSAGHAAPPGKFVRVFMTGENFEPDMSVCEFAITFSSLVHHENHLRLPLWVYENRAWGYGPERLVKRADTDWEKVAAEKTAVLQFRLPAPGPVSRRHLPHAERLQARRFRRPSSQHHERLDRADDAEPRRREDRFLPPLQIHARRRELPSGPAT